MKTLINNYKQMVAKASDIADGWHFDAEYIDYDEKAGIIEVYGTEYCRGEARDESYTFPIEWMLMTPEQVEDAKAEKKRQEELARQKRAEEKAAREAFEKEQKERAEYERLKQKYGDA